MAILSFIMAVNFANGQELFYRVAIPVSGAINAAKLGIAIEDGHISPEKQLILEISAQEKEKLETAGIPTETRIEDLTAYYAGRNAQLSIQPAGTDGLRDIPVPQDFTLGSMGGFCTLSELYYHLDNMYSKYPNLITEKTQLAAYNTYEGRPVYYVKISDNPNNNEDETKVLYTGMHHAREPISLQQMLFFMYHLLENYETDTYIKQLIDTTELYFIPCLNPDGYEYNRQISPNGGGMWRKNRRDNLNSSYGVDLNRNYGYQWAYDDIGSSPDPFAMTYRGPSAFSEPETQMIKEFCEEKQFPFVLNYHSYSNILLFPWGYIGDTTSDNKYFTEFAHKMTDDNSYPYGPASLMLYSVNGNSDDWMYGEQISKPKIYAFTPEVGNYNEGFWPSIDRIVPLCQDQVHANFLAARFAGRYALTKDISRLVLTQKTGYLKFSLKRYGLEDGVPYTITIQPVGNSFASLGDPKTFLNPPMMTTLTDSIPFTLNDAITDGDEIAYLLITTDGHFTHTDTIKKIYGTPQPVFFDDCNTMANWSSQKWDISTFFFTSPPASITDSRFGNYGSNANTYVFSTTEIDLTAAKAAVLSFFARWETERRHDYIQVKASTDGAVFQPLTGKFTRPSPNPLIPDQPVYDGKQTDWTYEEINLKDYVGQRITLMFHLRANELINLDGFYFDDLSVSIFDGNTGQEPKTPLGETFRLQPNPANTYTVLSVIGVEKPATANIRVFDLSGRQLDVAVTREDNTRFRLHIHHLKPGIYLVEVSCKGRTSVSQKLMIH